MTEAMTEATVLMVLAFLGMRVLYGSWPWEGHKTWYATRRLSVPVEPDEEGISLSPEQIADAAASAASKTNSQPDTATVPPVEPEEGETDGDLSARVGRLHLAMSA
ncbi:MAG TPA: hypothetical protein VEC94_16175 [Pseudolabrys sp.]|nr:hypothetical protein [Pseudolabrys sp.]